MADGADLKSAEAVNGAHAENDKDDVKMAGMDDSNTNVSDASPSVTLIAKWGKERITLSDLSPGTTIGQVKSMITDQTGVLPKRQKLVGLSTATKSQPLTDQVELSALRQPKKSKQTLSSDDNNNTVTHSFILMGTPEEKIFVDPSDKDDLPDVIDDFELDFTAGSEMWLSHVANGQNLKKFTESTSVHIMNPPRQGKPLMVLDLDHTLLDFSSRTLQQQEHSTLSFSSAAALMKRPYMDQFLTSAYRHYDLVVWSQTSWRWLETKLTELGMLTHAGYKFCFVLDKTSMFAIKSQKRDGSTFTHHVKPLQIIWTKFPQWSCSNTVHLDDLSRNFALNLGSGLKVTAYFRKKSKAKRDVELVGLSRYLEQLARSGFDFDSVDFGKWEEVVSGKQQLEDTVNKNNDK